MILGLSESHFSRCRSPPVLLAARKPVRIERMLELDGFMSAPIKAAGKWDNCGGARPANKRRQVQSSASYELYAIISHTGDGVSDIGARKRNCRLRASVMREGSWLVLTHLCALFCVDGGHYVCLVGGEGITQDGEWYTISDSSVTKADAPSVDDVELSRNSILLFYRRRAT